MFSKFSPTTTSFILQDRKGNPKAMYVSDIHAQDPELRKILIARKKEGRLQSIDWMKGVLK